MAIKSYCPILHNSMSEEELSTAYPGMTSGACNNYNNVESQVGQQIAADMTWQDLINSAGQPVYYYVYQYDKDRAEKLFGEDALAEFAEPFEIKVFLEIKDVPASFGPWGGNYANDSVSGYIHIKTFAETGKLSGVYDNLKLRIEPKVHDVFQIIGYGCDRPGIRGANCYEITSKDDQMISDNINAAFGHYVWKIQAKRFVYSHEGGAIEEFGEDGNCQIYDNRIEGIIPEGETEETVFQDKAYDYDVDEESKKKIFNQNINNQSDIYGGYYS